MDTGHSGTRHLTFFDLPPEVRNQIYENIRLDIVASEVSGVGERFMSSQCVPRQITRTSRQLREETLSLLSSSMMFKFSTIHPRDVYTMGWVRRVSADTVASIRKFEIWQHHSEAPTLMIDLDNMPNGVVFGRHISVGKARSTGGERMRRRVRSPWEMESETLVRKATQVFESIEIEDGRGVISREQLARLFDMTSNRHPSSLDDEP